MPIIDPLVLIAIRQLKNLATADLPLEERDFRYGELTNILQEHKTARVYLRMLKDDSNDISNDAHVCFLELLLKETDTLSRRDVGPLLRSFIQHSDSRCRFLVVKSLLQIRKSERKSGNGDLRLGFRFMNEVEQIAQSDHSESRSQIIASFAKSLLSIRDKHACRTMSEIAEMDRTSEDRTDVVARLLDGYRTSIADSAKWDAIRIANRPRSIDGEAEFDRRRSDTNSPNDFDEGDPRETL